MTADLPVLSLFPFRLLGQELKLLVFLPDVNLEMKKLSIEHSCTIHQIQITVIETKKGRPVKI